METIGKRPKTAYNATKFCYTKEKVLRGCLNCKYYKEVECPLSLLTKLNKMINKHKEERR